MMTSATAFQHMVWQGQGVFLLRRCEHLRSVTCRWQPQPSQRATLVDCPELRTVHPQAAHKSLGCCFCHHVWQHTQALHHLQPSAYVLQALFLQALLPCCSRVLQDHLLPEEYVSTMRDHMLDKCPVSPWQEVSQIIIEDLGAPPEALFKQFSKTPIASASLAQVGGMGKACLAALHAATQQPCHRAYNQSNSQRVYMHKCSCLVCAACSGGQLCS